MTKPTCFLGIDPGLSGAMAMIGSDEKALVVDWCSAQKMVDFIEIWGKNYQITLAGLEKVWGRPGQNVKSTSILMENFGTWKGILSTLDIDFIELPPNHWQTILENEEGKDSKKKSLAAARREFPELYSLLKKESHHNRADALNICRYTKEYR